MADYFYSNQFEPSDAIGSLDMSSPPNSIMTVRLDPTQAATYIMYPGQGVVLKDLGANDVNSSGVPIVGKRTNNYDALYGVKIANIKKNANIPGDCFDIAKKGAIIKLKCAEAIARNAKVSLVIATTGSIINHIAGYAIAGVALDKGTTGGIIRVELTCDDTAVAST